MKALLFGILLMSKLFAFEENEAEVEDVSFEVVANLEIPEEPAYLSSYQSELAPQAPAMAEQQRSYYPIVYGQLYFVIPGAGIGIRKFNRRIGFEGDFSFPIFAIKSSASILLRLSRNLEKGWYAGTGIGGGINFDSEHTVFPYVPLFLGYEGDRFFGDLGFDYIFIPWILPVFRFGVRF